jgi:hypothetical protein
MKLLKYMKKLQDTFVLNEMHEELQDTFVLNEMHEELHICFK